jgi:hypothetical protein
MKRLKKMLWLVSSLVLISFLIVLSALAIVEHIKQETLGTMPDGISKLVGEAATGSLNNDTQKESEYQRGYEAGYQAGVRDAYQWMITAIQEQMAGTSSKYPKVEMISGGVVLDNDWS